MIRIIIYQYHSQRPSGNFFNNPGSLMHHKQLKKMVPHISRPAPSSTTPQSRGNVAHQSGDRPLGNSLKSEDPVKSRWQPKIMT